MYSLVLMAALSTGGEAPNFFFHKWGGHGCHGMSSGHGCWGGSGGCYGGSAGCHGGGCHGWASCHGGGHGWGLRHRWFGHGCASACSGYSCSSSYGCSGACWGSNYGCSGACWGGCAHGGGGVQIMQPAMGSVIHTAPAGSIVVKPAQPSTSAKLVVALPENAKLFVDDQPFKVTSSNRTFNTPALQAGQTYFYLLRAEVVQNGKTHTETKRILVQAGETVQASFPELERTLTAATAPPPAVTETDED